MELRNGGYLDGLLLKTFGMERTLDWGWLPRDNAFEIRGNSRMTQSGGVFRVKVSSRQSQTSGGSGAAKASGWIGCCGDLGEGFWLLKHMPSSS